MPIMAAQGQHDARGAARLLASAAKDCITNPASAPERRVALNNVYRLLEAYRANAFFGFEPASNEADTTETVTLFLPVERYVGEVRDALAQGIAVAFAGQAENQAIELIEGVLRGVTYPQRFQHPSPEDRTKATRFFDEVLQHLQTA